MSTNADEYADTVLGFPYVHPPDGETITSMPGVTDHFLTFDWRWDPAVPRLQIALPSRHQFERLLWLLGRSERERNRASGCVSTICDDPKDKSTFAVFCDWLLELTQEQGRHGDAETLEAVANE